MNTLKKNSENEQEVKSVKAPGKFIKGVASVLNGSFIVKENVVKQLPFLLFLVMIAMIHITNSYYAEKTVRDINTIGNEIKELKSEYITTKSDLMHVSKQSQVAALALSLRVKESTVPPKKISIHNTTTNEEKNN